MKKTVSWSADTKQQDASSAAGNGDDATGANATTSRQSAMHKSSSAHVAPISNVQVNLRIQQMIAMQKAQNASMRQSITTGASSASPSGLRDLVLPHRGGAVSSNPPLQVGGVGGAGAPSSGAKPALPQGKVDATSQPQASPAGIHFQGQPARNRLPPQAGAAGVGHGHGQGQGHGYGGISNHYDNAARSSPVWSPPPPLPPGHIRDEITDSPLSYNSVLHQHGHPQLIGAPVGEVNAASYSRETAVPEPKIVPMKAGAPQFGQGGQFGHSDFLGVVPGDNVVSYQRDPVQSYQRDPIQLSPQPKVVPMKGGQYGYSDFLGAPAQPPAAEAHANYQTRLHEAPYHQASAADPAPYQPRLPQNGGRLADAPAPPPPMPPPYGMQVGVVESDTSPLVPHTHHEFYYGDDGKNNAYLETYDTPSHLETRVRRRRREFVWAILCYPLRCIFGSDHLSRSFCCGAIDGVLTGASILSACVGLGLCSGGGLHGAAWVRDDRIIAALTLAATVADGICIAIGHAWSTHLDATTGYRERKEELRNFAMYRADSKARLVDALLAQGVLKIDAMSLADTLEGYPDLFVNALLGGGPSVDSSGDGAHGGAFPRRQWSGAGAGLGQNRLEEQSNYDSYYEYQDPNHQVMSEMVTEGRLEGFVMLLSFSSFSVIPSLIYAYLPTVVDVTANGIAENGLITLCLSCLIVFALGAWRR